MLSIVLNSPAPAPAPALPDPLPSPLPNPCTRLYPPYPSIYSTLHYPMYTTLSTTHHDLPCLTMPLHISYLFTTLSYVCVCVCVWWLGYLTEGTGQALLRSLTKMKVGRVYRSTLRQRPRADSRRGCSIVLF